MSKRRNIVGVRVTLGRDKTEVCSVAQTSRGTRYLAGVVVVEDGTSDVKALKVALPAAVEQALAGE